MNATTNIGLFTMIAYVYYHTNVKPIPYTYSVPFLLILSAVGSFLSAAIYNVTIGIRMNGYFFLLIISSSLP